MVIWGITSVLPLEAQQQEAPIVVGKSYMHMVLRAEVDSRSRRYLRLALEAAQQAEVRCILLELDTFGGALNDADKMRQMLLDHPQPIYVWINKNAASAGALLSLACDSIYMSPGASIGAATVVSGMDGQALPDKYQSYMRALMRATAEHQGRDPHTAEAMVDPDVALDSLAPAGKVLTLTSQQALARGFCEAELPTLDAIVARLQLQGHEAFFYELPPLEVVIAFFIHPAVSSVLILLILWGLYAELQTPGVGFPGGVALAAALLYLVPYYLNGLAANWEVVVLFAGIALVGLEVLAFPGFGFAGIAGVVLAAGALMLIMLGNMVFDFSLVPAEAMTEAALSVLFALLGGAGLMLLLAQRAHRLPFYRRFALTGEQKAEHGYRTGAAVAAKTSLLSATGHVESVLRPSGRVRIRGQVYEATSDTGDYLAVGTSIRVVSEEGRELRVVATDNISHTI